jgi:hypothetical protein
MITYVIATFLTAAAAGAGALVHAFAGAPVGLEDELGFHADSTAPAAGEVIAYIGHDRRRAHESYSGPRRRSSDYGAGPLLSGA